MDTQTPVYVWLARREDRELAARFGEAFDVYAARTPAFLSGRSPRSRAVARVAPADHGLGEARSARVHSRSEG